MHPQNSCRIASPYLYMKHFGNYSNNMHWVLLCFDFPVYSKDPLFPGNMDEPPLPLPLY